MLNFKSISGITTYIKSNFMEDNILRVHQDPYAKFYLINNTF